MNKEKLKKELDEIDEKLKLKNIQIKNSSEYKLIETTISNLWEEKDKINKKLKNLKKPIYLKYIHNLIGWGGFNFKTKAIKSSVKQGIKGGLETTSVAFINEYALRNIVKQLINKDLEKIKTQIDNLKRKIEKNEIQLTKCLDGKKKLMDGLNPLRKQRKKIEDKLNEKDLLKEKRINEKKKDVEIKIKNLPKFMDKIIKEVNRRLILDGLK